MYDSIRIYYSDDVLNKRKQLINDDTMIRDLNDFKHFDKEIARLFQKVFDVFRFK